MKQAGGRIEFVRWLNGFTSDYLKNSHEQLQVVLARLDPILGQHGFQFHPEYNAVSSGGPFSNGFYGRPPIRIGLIVRGDELGCPNYDYEKYKSGHSELIQQLGRAEDARLRFDDDLAKWKLVTVDGRDILDALVADLENIILPTIINDVSVYRQAVMAAQNARMKRWRGN